MCLEFAELFARAKEEGLGVILSFDLQTGSHGILQLPLNFCITLSQLLDDGGPSF